ncbi:MAG: cysteine hydrolase [Trueperaceae bacterium]|nr:MAG: cysteine hydrolase [Trueperaceae bacterium]
MPRLPDRPEVPEVPTEASVRLDAERSAVLVVDMQHDFVHEDGALYGPDAARAVPVIEAVLRRARSAGARVMYSQDWHGDDDPEFVIWGEHAKAGSWGAEIVAPLAPQQGDEVFRKLRYDAFYGTALDHRLRTLGVRHLVIVGTVANICVLHTAGSAALRHYDVVVVDDGIGALTDFDRAATLRQVTFLYGGRVTSADGLAFA